MLSDLGAQCGGPKYGENVNNASQAEQIGVALHFSKQQGRKDGNLLYVRVTAELNPGSRSCNREWTGSEQN
jgi:hypothetical protein